ncbi:MAG: response regulator [Mucilaginibacter sp.]
MKKIVILEDDIEIVELVKIILARAGHKVIALYDAKDFKIRLNEIKPDLILLDLDINGFDGITICDYIKNNYSLANIPVILFSANPDIKAIQKRCNADQVIRKPFDIITLVRTVNNYALAH